LLIEKHSRAADKHIIGLWLCHCGKKFTCINSRIRTGVTKSCGCLFDASKGNLKHGMRKSPEYSSWRAMLHRCRNPNSKDYARYGGSGISVHPEWVESFEKFYEHIGPRPNGTTLDRINGKLGYIPNNVRWATLKQQARNKSNFVIVKTPDGKMPLVDYAKKIGISKGAAHLRLKRGKLEGVTIDG
jgi:hypothetical protein